MYGIYKEYRGPGGGGGRAPPSTVRNIEGPGPGWGPVRVGALSGLGPCPGWGPVRVGALSGLGPCPGWGLVRVGALSRVGAHMGP